MSTNENIALGACRVYYYLPGSDFDVSSAFDFGYTTGGSSATIQTDYDETIFDSFGVITSINRVKKVSANLTFTTLNMGGAGLAFMNAMKAPEGNTPTTRVNIAFVPIDKRLPMVLFQDCIVATAAVSMKSDTEGSIAWTMNTSPKGGSQGIYSFVSQS